MLLADGDLKMKEESIGQLDMEDSDGSTSCIEIRRPGWGVKKRST